MQDLVNHNGSFHQTLCGRSVSSSGDGNDGTTIGNSLPNRSMTRAPLGLLAGCRFPNSTWLFLRETDLMEAYRNWTNGAGNSSRNANDTSKPKQCSQLNYNTTNQPGK